ncbi:MAG TPA: ABC transporter substrate-binding protein [Chitinophagaceae bacterium]|nr:ABC transporter substrate-binding protein [Chitinophagaceae bacterium]
MIKSTKIVGNVMLAFVLLLHSCKNEISDRKIFRLNQVQNVESLDPAFAKNLNIMWHVHFIYNRLIEFDQKKNPTPSLAKSWTISPDRLTYTFHLQNAVFFHPNEAFPNGQGRRMTAKDVEYSFYRIIDEKTASPGAWIFNDRVDDHQPFLALDDTTFQLKLKRPFNPMLGILSMQYCSIVPHEVVEKWGKDFRAHPCGTGPFVLQDWEESVAVTYRKNTNYWEKDSLGNTLPYIDGIKVTQVDSKSTEFLMFMQGKLDFMNGIDASFKDQVMNKDGSLKAEYQEKVELKKSPYLNVEYLGFLLNEEKNPQKILLNKQLRKAINNGFDRRKLVTYLRNNIGIPAEAGMIPAGLAGYDSSLVKGYTYQPEIAKKIIQDLKQKNGGSLPAITLLSNDNYSDRCNFIASQLSNLGLEIIVEILQPSLLREQMSNEQAPFFWGTWIADYPDAESYLTMFYGKNGAPPNYTRFHNDEYDRLYEQSLVETNEEKKLEMYMMMDRIIIEEAPCVPLFYDEVLHFIQKRVKNWNTNNLNLLELKEVKLMD